MFKIIVATGVGEAMAWRSAPALAAAPQTMARRGFRMFVAPGCGAARVFTQLGRSAGVVATITGAGGIPSAEAFGTPTITTPVVGQITGAGGIASAEVFGVPEIFVTRPQTVTTTSNAAAVSGDSVLAGMSAAELQAALTAAQRAYTELMTGTKVVTASYAQADGMKSVTYTKAELPALTAFIRQLQVALGITTQARRPARFIFR